MSKRIPDWALPVIFIGGLVLWGLILDGTIGLGTLQNLLGFAGNNAGPLWLP